MSEGRLIKNKLRIVRQVGRGGMGYVYEVFHEGLRVTRALKQIVGDLQDNPEIERRFLHEAQMMARLEHPHIVRVFDIDQEPDFGTYLLMEFIRGRDLGELLRQEGRFPYGETLRIGIAVASALDCAHRAGLVHRDIKPANILIEDGTGRPVVTDFGIAKEVESAGDESFTRTGSFVGTYRYSSREQIRSEKGVPIDGRADIYSLGVVLYEIFAGRKYLAGMPELKIASCVGYQDDWQPELDYPDSPPALFGQVILDCLAPERDLRVKNASELVRRLEECRRVESVDVAGGGASAAEASLAASAATTRTAPTPSQAGTQMASALGEMTATTRDEPERPQTATETRSQWVALLQGLRGAVDDQAGEFERLLKELIALDIPRDDFRQLDDMSQILHRVERAEGDGQYQEAASNLQGLSDRIQHLNADIERTVTSAIETRSGELSQAWRELAANAGDLLAPERTSAFEQLLAPVPRLLEANDWERAREALRGARGQLEQAQGEVKSAAGERVGEAMRELRIAHDYLRERSAETAAATGFEPDAVQREVAAALEENGFANAMRRSAFALNEVRGAIVKLDRDERLRADAARGEAEQARAALDAAEARELAADELSAAEAADAEAASLVVDGDMKRAAARYADAARLYAAAAERVRGRSAEQVDAAAAALARLVEGAAAAPAEVAGEARRAAQELIGGARPRERRAALAALEGASSALERALADVTPFEAARDAERAATTARESASALGAGKGDLSEADRGLDAGRAALARRDWAAAREELARAAAVFEQVGRDVVARGEGERLTAARSQIDDALGNLDTTLAGELCAAEIERALRLREAADAAERSGDRVAALAASGEAIGALREAEQALFVGLGERAAALAGEARSFATHAGGLLDDRRRQEIERGVAAVQQALSRRDGRAVASALDESWRLLGDLRVDLDQRTRAAAGEGLAAIRALLEAQAPRAAKLDVDPDLLGSTVDAMLGEERFAEARAAVDDALARVRSVVESERARLTRDVAEARHAAEEARRPLERDAARRLAGEELASADAAFAAAERAQRDGDLAEAARLHREAADAANALQALLRERQVAEVEDERSGLAQALVASEGAADEIAGRARADARALLEATVAGDLGQASGTIRAARAALEQATAEATLFVAARDRQAAARGAEKRAGELGASRRQVKAAASLLRDADAAFGRKAWPAAEAAYAKAADGYGAVVAELERALEKLQAAARAKAEAADKAAAEKAARARDAQAAADAAAARERERREQAAQAKAAQEAEQRERRAAQARDAEAKARERAAAPQAKEAKEPPRAQERDRAGDATVLAGAADATVLADASDATVVGRATEATRLGAALPEAQRRGGLPVAWLGGGVAALLVAGGVAFWLLQGEAPAPSAPKKVAKVESPAKQAEPPAPPKAKAVPPPVEPPAEQPAEQPAKTEPEAPAVQPEPELKAEQPPVQVAKVPPPSPAAPPPLRISGFTPDAGEVALKEGAKQAFAIDVAGGVAGTKPNITWRLDDKIVARDVAKWEYAPGFDAASDASRTLEVVVGEGDEAAKRSWQLDVANVNRKPKLTTSPKAGGKVEAKVGDTVKLRADVKDDDGDKIAYAWTLDGKPAGDQAQLDVPVTGDRTVGLTATDGDAEVTASWQIAAVKPALKIDTTPARLERLRFEKPQDFALSPPSDASGLEYEWSVDGKKVASGPRFTFANDDPALVRRSPVEVAVAARDAQGRTFERSWEFVVDPPAPQVTLSTPPTGTVDVSSGSTQTFEIAAPDPIGGQSLSYVFQVDGKQAARGPSPRFEYRVSDDKPHRIVGYVQDNFDQVSSRSEWSIAPSSGILTRAQSWLDDYQAAFNAKDAQRIGQLRGLPADKVAELQKVLEDQSGLRVTFSNVRIDRVDDQRARLTYTRTDDFTDVRGSPVSRTGTVEQVIGVVNGRLTELETRRR